MIDIDKNQLAGFIKRQEREEIRQDTIVSKEYFNYIKNYDRNNIPIGICSFLDRNLHDEESYRIMSSIVMCGDSGGPYPSDIKRILGDMSNHTATRWEAMIATGLVSQPDADNENDGTYDYYDLDVSKLARYIRFMGFDNPFATGEAQ